ncbi:hypothetical protein DPMN_019365 [Dreissena polymorpha]|uniref:Uncharacterized protein n=1 Tax=Dreissena polymorpha TaxID=45954 RepID=A0A9D4RSD1_DREPO|nr:hypothetical protein DPMN_003748 [Dreissena polymorpha]KAH3895205.1 hypothetical protein DPMN_019365 [Dreissena polymorpha]
MIMHTRLMSYSPIQPGAGGHKPFRAIVALVKRTTHLMFQMISHSVPRRAVEAGAGGSQCDCEVCSA